EGDQVIEVLYFAIGEEAGVLGGSKQDRLGIGPAHYLPLAVHPAGCTEPSAQIAQVHPTAILPEHRLSIVFTGNLACAPAIPDIGSLGGRAHHSVLPDKVLLALASRQIGIAHDHTGIVDGECLAVGSAESAQVP